MPSVASSWVAPKSAVLGGTAAVAGTAYPFLDASGNQCAIPFLGSSRLDGQPFRIKAAGKFTGGSSTVTILISLYFGAVTVAKPLTISATASSNTLIETVPVQTITSLNGNFYMEVTGIWDKTSGRLTCYGTSVSSITDGTGTLTASTIADAIPAAVTTLNTEGTNAFCVFGTFGTTAVAANAAYLTLFSLELI